MRSLRLAVSDLRILSGFLGLVLAGQSVAEDQWSGFQNSGRLIVSELPDAWDAQGKNVAWKAELLGYGQSTPVVYGDQVYVTSTSGPNKENCHVTAYALLDGSKRWQKDFQNPSPEPSNSYVSRAAPTPVVDSQGLVVSFEGGLLIGLAFDGKLRWEKNLVDLYGPIKARHGLASSLEQDSNNVYVWVEREQEPYVLALNKASGDVVWKSAGVGATSWSSPRLLTVAGKPQLLCSSSGKIAGYDTATGSKLWEFTDLANNTTCTPIPVADGKFLIGASDGRGEQSSGKTAASNGLIQIKPIGDGKFDIDYVWRAEKATCSFGSPIVAADKVWIVNRTGVLYQLDLATGNQISAERVSAGSVWATPLATQDKLYLFGQKGTTSIVELATAKEIATCLTWEDAEQAPAAAMGGPVLYAALGVNNTLLIRRGDLLVAIRQ
ncbi:MAG: PQQ-binding-like beta-propeller repeat protein [Planctomycetota bacterium]|jgi:outer membrane protein assembly factor BamB